MKMKKFNIGDIREVQFYLDDLKFRMLEKQSKLKQELTAINEKKVELLEHNINQIGTAQEALSQVRTR